MKRILLLFCLFLFASSAAAAETWWNPEWQHRKKISLDTTEAGAGTKEALLQFAIPVRLHTGNFLFPDALPDGKDLRFVAADDKTPLKFQIERYDSANELAIVWVQLPRLPGASNSEFLWMYYGNRKAVAGEDAKGIFDPNTLAVFHFGEREGAPRDASAFANHAGQSGVKPVEGGLIGPAAAVDGKSRFTVGASASLKFSPAQGLTWSAWLKPASEQGRAVLFALTEGGKSLQVMMEGDAVYARIAADKGKPVESGRQARITPGAWSHVAVSFKDRIVVYVNGVEAAAAGGAMPEMGGDIAVGEGYSGDIDEMQLANVARGPDWIRAQFQSQAAEGRLIAYGEGEATESGGEVSYFGILVSALTLDAWIVIGILGVMFVISTFVMVEKALFVARAARGNAGFREAFAGLQDDLSVLRAAPNPPDASPLHRLYELGVGELDKRLAASKAQGKAQRLTPQAMDSIRASLDAGMSRESQRLNNRMVLLTIAISGGPFLGLLGTVVGVMIVFAAVAAAGDVNVNAIAPGIAAALLATVAGLGVAIPALFGYNYLAGRIKEVTADMRVFADELLTKLAERHVD